MHKAKGEMSFLRKRLSDDFADEGLFFFDCIWGLNIVAIPLWNAALLGIPASKVLIQQTFAAAEIP
jgi:hypothetical protein